MQTIRVTLELQQQEHEQQGRNSTQGMVQGAPNVTWCAWPSARCSSAPSHTYRVQPTGHEPCKHCQHSTGQRPIEAGACVEEMTVMLHGSAAQHSKPLAKVQV